MQLSALRVLAFIAPLGYLLGSASAQTFSCTGSSTTFTATTAGVYHIVANGAQGGFDSHGGPQGGLGAQVAGDFTLTTGQMLTIAVGCEGKHGIDSANGGGGGTFVVFGSTPLLVAGGGGGNGISGNAGGPGQTTTAGANGGGAGGGLGGIGGNGGGGGANHGAGGGGGGFITAGGNGFSPADSGLGGQPFPNLAGGAGILGGDGGFGGGGGGGDRAGGGGGGFSGGGGGDGASDLGGGGGGSFISAQAINTFSSAGTNAGNGSVLITLLSTLTFTLDIPFQAKIFPNLTTGDSLINIGNTGASAAIAVAPAVVPGNFAIGGNLCVNVYVFSPDEQEVACCTCFVTPNGVVTTTARQLISKTLTPAVPTAVTVKLVATDGSGGAASCNAATPAAVRPGLIAFGTNIHAAPVGGSNTAGTFAVTETPFIPATLSAAELSRISTLCGFIQSNGTGFGVCPGCAAGAAGAIRN